MALPAFCAVDGKHPFNFVPQLQAMTPEESKANQGILEGVEALGGGYGQKRSFAATVQQGERLHTAPRSTMTEVSRLSSARRRELLEIEVMTQSAEQWHWDRLNAPPADSEFARPAKGSAASEPSLFWPTP
ncbi:hypothetical protein LJR290_007877 [Variovorax sp. LjRoot290]|uniref:hypothetical protein n=1 Tax=Variovorax sp. LjRoot290 TaxID=3342316 RepID=UPI003ECF8CA6